MGRISFSPAERNFCSRLAQLAHDNWLLRGRGLPNRAKEENGEAYEKSLGMRHFRAFRARTDPSLGCRSRSE